MTTYVALLRAVNVGGTGKLPMTELKATCEEAGFSAPQTYIASGNVVFDSPLGAADVKAALENRLEAYAGKPVAVMVRTAAEMAAIVDANPFPGVEGNRLVVMFLDDAPPVDAADQARNVADEAIKPGKREIYVHYPSGQGRSKLVIPAAKGATARNMNTVLKMAELAAGR
ncbi:MAG: DUF1697 domain-containing protein [Rhizobiaceae bacterium]